MGNERKICIVTTNRADWSKLEPIARLIKEDTDLKLQLVVTGSHLLAEFGRSISGIAREFDIDDAPYTLVSGDHLSSMADSVGLSITKLTGTFGRLRPDCVVIHGDRFDAFAACIAASMMNIPVAHIEGGELSGTVDGMLRHSITKLSRLHFPCNEDAARRLRSMGESSDTIFITGCPSYDRLFQLRDSPSSLALLQNIKVGSGWAEPGQFLVASHHPTTTEPETAIKEYETLLSALFDFQKPTLLFYPNVDPGNKSLIQCLHAFQHKFPDWPKWLTVKTHLEADLFAILMKEAGLFVGNSSAGVRETCVFGTPTINLGLRQAGRLLPLNVTSMPNPSSTELLHAMKELMGKTYQSSSLFGKRNSASKIISVLKEVELDHTAKHFSEPEYALTDPPRVDEPESPSNQSRHFEDKNLKVLGLITARGGSKGVPGKNVADLCGKPLVAYTALAAKQANLLDRIVISTDCSVIARAAENEGVEVPFMRPAELARDDSPHIDCVQHALETLQKEDGYMPDYVMILQPTSPFRTGDDIDAAIQMAAKYQCDAVVSVTRQHAHPSKMHYMDKKARAYPCVTRTSPSSGVYLRRQSIFPRYLENGAIFLQKAESILHPRATLRSGSLQTEDLRLLEMPPERSLDIDDLFDLRMARLLMQDILNNDHQSGKAKDLQHGVPV